ncbi:MAG: alpha/beta hydrolase [Gammaproteobacteria bacterium]|nr:alpha/beta hydrolase [Gammaproteobacteria bacterium]MBU2059523.1 alpha/beta hydrolase [Gammaproteobacteria bacterium]MBU2176183.1 alpha/beta hydrolase [Gammaproteobacteria bacterium]MBU2248116.1 alpha/beta hydrolase [Gammaproteobacteria bacterium]MBU2344764.1 alpha/beta hydrolase [Gammaproteobacteria bacterium]
MNTKQILLAATALAASLSATATEDKTLVRYQSLDVQGVNVFYREAGSPQAPAVLLLHGFGASSYMFRDLMPKLAEKYHVVAPDLPGFGQTTVKPGVKFNYNFDNLAAVIDAFTVAKNLEHYAMYVFDYGAPVGWRLAVKNPEKITAIVTQNGNGYEEGLSEGWADMRKAWANPTAENREALRQFNTPEMLKWQYTEGVEDSSVIAPEPYQLAHAAIERIGVDVQMDLLLDYGSNVKQYKELHQFFRSKQPPLLAIWGEKDPFFLPAGAKAFQPDNPKAEVRFLNTGHFAIETHGNEIAAAMLEFLDRSIKP